MSTLAIQVPTIWPTYKAHFQLSFIIDSKGRITSETPSNPENKPLKKQNNPWTEKEEAKRKMSKQLRPTQNTPLQPIFLAIAEDTWPEDEPSPTSPATGEGCQGTELTTDKTNNWENRAVATKSRTSYNITNREQEGTKPHTRHIENAY
jgi:hypothetical protein